MSQAGQTNVEGNPEVATQYVADVGVAVPSLNTLNVFGGAGIQTTATGDTLTISATSMATVWNVVTSASNPVTLVKENGYIAKGAGSVHFVLPASALIGDTYKIIGYGNLWSIAQNAGQSITIGSVTSTVGVGGSVTATMISDGIELVCVTTNAEFYETDVQGNPAIV